MISSPQGLFPILVFDAQDSWDALLGLAKPELDRRGLDRLQPLLAADCRAVVVERHYIDKDYRDTFSHFHSKRFSTPPSRCLRLHFFSNPITETELTSDAAAAQEGYLGYAVIRPTKPNCIGRTLIAHRVRTDKAAHLSLCREEVLLLGTKLPVEGFPFISQDADATVCAQSALWMLLRYYSNRYSWYSEILPFQITNLANQHALGNRVYPSTGLHSWQLAEALRLQRFSPVVYSRNQYGARFDHLLYTYIESGLPLMITVPEHVVVAYGHASDYSRTRPGTPADFAYSSHFNRAFVISDDNHFPYQMLHAGGPVGPRDSRYAWNQIEEFIVPLPEKVFLTAEHVQAAIETILKHPGTGIAALSPSLSVRPLLLRLFLTNSKSFKRRLRERGMGHPTVEQIYRQLPMPHFVWVCEIADYAEYSAERKVLGEVLWDATRNAYEPDGWIALHYPERLLVDVGAAFNKQQELKVFPLGPINSYSLFRANLHSL
jgi:hypothetical protein